MSRTRLLLAAIAAATLLGGCAATVAGSGSVGLPSSAYEVLPTPPPSQPSQPGGATPTGPHPSPAQPASVRCPTVTDPSAGLRFRCVTDGIAQRPDVIWPLNLTKKVETGWMLGEGSAGLTVPAGVRLSQIVDVVRTEMVALGEWGPQPGVTTLVNKAVTVAGVAGWVLQTQFTINPAYREQQGLAVRTERMWLVAVRASDTRVALWYVTLPDQVKRLWAGVPALIDSIQLL